MKPLTHLIAPLFIFLSVLSSCSKGGNGGSNGNCNTTVMRLHKWQATFDTEHYMEATWNGDGSINTLKVNVPLSEYRTAKFIYASGKIKEAVLFYNHNGEVYDTAVFHYNNDGKVDSMYLKGDDYFNRKLTYTNGKLTRVTRLVGASAVMYYLDVVTDASDNIVKAEEYWNDNGAFKKESIFTYTRDTKKSPLAGLAPYMLYLNDEYEIFWHWGPNNMTDQRYQDLTGSATDITSGYKFKYDGNCYPNSAQNTIMGQPIFEDPDFTFTYY